MACNCLPLSANTKWLKVLAGVVLLLYVTQLGVGIAAVYCTWTAYHYGLFRYSNPRQYFRICIFATVGLGVVTFLTIHAIVDCVRLRRLTPSKTPKRLCVSLRTLAGIINLGLWTATTILFWRTMRPVVIDPATRVNGALVPAFTQKSYTRYLAGKDTSMSVWILSIFSMCLVALQEIWLVRIRRATSATVHAGGEVDDIGRMQERYGEQGLGAKYTVPADAASVRSETTSLPPYEYSPEYLTVVDGKREAT